MAKTTLNEVCIVGSQMLSRFAILGVGVLFTSLFLLCALSNAAAPLPEDHDTFWEYRVIGDRLLMKNPSASMALVPSVYKGHDGLGITWWGEDIRLTFDDWSAHNPHALVRGPYLHVTWMDDRRGGEYKSFYKRSTDLGYTWEEEVVISDTLQEQEHGPPFIALSTNYLHAVWDYFWKPISEDGHIYYRRSLDDGATWEDTYYLSSYEKQSKPSIATLGDTVYVVFTRTIERHDSTLPEIHFRKSYDEGATWTEPRIIADYYPQLIDGVLRANEEGLHYVFQHKDNFDEPGNPYRSQEIFYIHSPDWGTTWTDPIFVSHRDSIHSQWASMCVDNEGTVHVTWFDYKFSPHGSMGDIFYANSMDNGQTWEEIQFLTDAHGATWSNIISRGDHLYLVWQDERHGSRNNEVYFRHSPERGRCWDPEIRLTRADNESLWNVIAEQNDTLYVFWTDSRDDPTNRHEELYFKRGYLEGTGVSESPPSQHSLYLTAYPNPFNEKVILRYGIAGDYRNQRVLLKIYNVRGQLVRTIFDSDLASGEYQTVWDGTDSKETKVSSGIYLCVLQVGQSRRVAPLLFLK